jgi:hypothetical protein
MLREPQALKATVVSGRSTRTRIAPGNTARSSLHANHVEGAAGAGGTHRSLAGLDEWGDQLLQEALSLISALKKEGADAGVFALD